LDNWTFVCLFVRETMKICADLDIAFVIPNFIIQDASYAEANAAFSVFGSTVTILMCWFHLMFNVKKHESLAKVIRIYEKWCLRT